jgi:hypothetical protein
MNALPFLLILLLATPAFAGPVTNAPDPTHGQELASKLCSNCHLVGSGNLMLAYKEYDNAQAVEIVLSGRVSTEEFDKVARKLEAFIERHGEIRVLEVIKDFEGMDAGAFWHDVQFSLRHVQDFSRIAIVTNPDVHHLWSSLVAPFMRCDVEHFSPGEMEAARDWLMWPEGAVD